MLPDPRPAGGVASSRTTTSSGSPPTAIACWPTSRPIPTSSTPETRRNEVVSLHRAGPRRHLDQPGRSDLGGSAPLGRVPRGLRVVRRPHQLHLGGGIPRRPRPVRPPVAGVGPSGRQGHPPVPRRLLAGDADVGRPAPAPADRRPRVPARGWREDVQVERQPDPARRTWSPTFGVGRLPLPLPAGCVLRARRQLLVGGHGRPLQRRSGQRLRQPGQPGAQPGRAVPGRARCRRSATADGAEETPLRAAAAEALEALAGFEEFKTKQALDGVWRLVRAANAFVEATEPWKLAKDDSMAGRLDQVLNAALEALRVVAILIWPAMPGAAASLWERLGLPGSPGDGPLADTGRLRRLPGGQGRPRAIRCSRGSRSTREHLGRLPLPPPHVRRSIRPSWWTGPPPPASSGWCAREPMPTGSEAALALADAFPGTVLAAAGLHPHDASRWPEEGERIAELAARSVAIGECGLDFYRNLSPREDQLAAFREQVPLAQDLDMPLIVHCPRCLHRDVRRTRGAPAPARAPSCTAGPAARSGPSGSPTWG